jgi:hypothetical protein
MLGKAANGCVLDEEASMDVDGFTGWSTAPVGRGGQQASRNSEWHCNNNNNNNINKTITIMVISSNSSSGSRRRSMIMMIVMMMMMIRSKDQLLSCLLANLIHHGGVKLGVGWIALEMVHLQPDWTSWTTGEWLSSADADAEAAVEAEAEGEAEEIAGDAPKRPPEHDDDYDSPGAVCRNSCNHRSALLYSPLLCHLPTTHVAVTTKLPLRRIAVRHA